jgi:hypothetical protein
MRAWLLKWRHVKSEATPAAGAGADPRLPRLKLLGRDTLLLVLPSFKATSLR